MSIGICNCAGHATLKLGGTEDNHAGGSMVVSPQGAIVAESQSTDIREEMTIPQLESEAVAKPQRFSCFSLQTRRPEVFGALCRAMEWGQYYGQPYLSRPCRDDPLETTNLASRAEQRPLMGELATHIVDWQRRTGDKVEVTPQSFG